MNEVNLQLKNIILQELKNINQKIKGASFLEILKFSLLEKIVNSRLNKQLNLNFSEEIIKYDDQHKNIEFSLLNCKSPKILINKKTDRDTLYICLEGNIIIDLYDFKHKNVSKNYNIKVDNGITIPKETICNVNHTKDTKLIEILLEDKVVGVEIEKESTI